MNDDFISRKEVLKKQDLFSCYCGEDECEFSFIPLNVVENEPAADVVEVRRGRWGKRGNEKTCSECRFIYYSNNDEWNFCPNCGAKMDKNETE